jgi:hypothetical protein
MITNKEPGEGRFCKHSLCYNDFMALKEDMIAYVNRWRLVADIEQEELKAASIELRWQQLNSVIALAIGLDILKSDPTEEGIYYRWAELKEKAANQHLQS